MTLPLVSAIVPCYNDGRYIEDTIASIQNQTYQNIEVIVVDDGSTDTHTLKVLGSLKLGTIQVLWQPNGKTSKARNLGFKHAKGTYLLAIDADDILEATFVEKSVHILEEYPKIGAVSSWVLGFGYQNFIWTPRGGGVKNFIEDINCSANAIIRREVWEMNEGFDESMVYGYEDWEFWINTTKKGYLVHIIEEFLIYYRRTWGSRAKDAVDHRDEIKAYLINKHPDVFQHFG
ncbi:MAG: glycosyltransferase family A protein [Bacteroidota bacterium]